MQANRLFEIIYILLNKESVTAKELAAQFGISTRTIYRDIDTLSLAGIPVYTEKGKGGGISLLPDFVLNKSILSETEQNEILTALHGLSNIKADEANGILNRLSTIFNKTAANWLEVDFPIGVMKMTSSQILRLRYWSGALRHSIITTHMVKKLSGE